MKVKTLTIEEAVGLPLSHDLTQIDANSGYKGPRFKKGHVVTEEDLPTLRAMGRQRVSVLELESDELHEDEAALELAKALAGEGLKITGPDEGKCNLVSEVAGLLIFDEECVHAINEDDQWLLATLLPKASVSSGEVVAAMRIRPLFMRRERVARAVGLAKPMGVAPFIDLRVALVTTGKELADGLISDAFRPKLEKKIRRFGGSLIGQVVVGDAQGEIEGAIESFLHDGADLVICTGGMSVDADDCTPSAIASTSDEVIFQGVPALPGTMLMLAKRGSAFIVGAPACVVHDEWTTLDVLLERLFAGVVPLKGEVRRWGVGGLCRHCAACNFPVCPFANRP